MKFYIGEEVIFLRGNQKFQHGKILNCSDIYGVGIYEVDLLNGTRLSNVIEYDIISTDKSKNINEPTETLNIDISKYLTKDQMENLACDMFKLKVSRKIDDALEARKGQGSMVELMVHEITTDYAKRLGDKFETELVQRIKEVIYLKEESSADDYDDTFLGSIKNILWSTTKEWVDGHKEEVMEWILPELKSFIEKLMIDMTAKEISQKFGSIIQESLNNIIKELYDNGRATETSNK